jgi:hypothetical protein
MLMPWTSSSPRRRHDFLSPTASIWWQAEAAMFVIELTDTAALAEIDARVSFLRKYYASGNFLEDSSYARGLADFRMIQFRASQRADEIQQRTDR